MFVFLFLLSFLSTPALSSTNPYGLCISDSIFNKDIYISANDINAEKFPSKLCHQDCQANIYHVPTVSHVPPHSMDQLNWFQFQYKRTGASCGEIPECDLNSTLSLSWKQSDFGDFPNYCSGKCLFTPTFLPACANGLCSGDFKALGKSCDAEGFIQGGDTGGGSGGDGGGSGGDGGGSDSNGVFSAQDSANISKTLSYAASIDVNLRESMDRNTQRYIQMSDQLSGFHSSDNKNFLQLNDKIDNLSQNLEMTNSNINYNLQDINASIKLINDNMNSGSGGSGSGKDYTSILNSIKSEIGGLGSLVMGSCTQESRSIPIQTALNSYEQTKIKFKNEIESLISKSKEHEFIGHASIPSFCSYIDAFDYNFCLDFSVFNEHLDLIRKILLAAAYIFAAMIIFLR